MGVFNELDLAMQEYADHLVADYGRPEVDFKIVFIPGRNYIKVVVDNRGSRSSHSWIVLKPTKGFKFGDILKSASWKAPATNFARGNLLEGKFKHIRWCGI